MKRIGIVIVVLVGLYFMPFIREDVKDSKGRIWRAPFLSNVKEVKEDQILFSNIRSSYALKKDVVNAIDSYPEMKCYGRVYHYSKENDVSITDYEVKDGLHPEIIYHFEKGNACLGWGKDEEIAFPYGPISQMQLDQVPSNWQEIGFLVIENGKAWNQGVYDQFVKRAERGICSFLRTYLVQDGKPIKVVDLQVLDTDENRILTKIKDEDGVHEERFSRLQFTSNDNKRIVEAFKEEASTNEGIEMFSFTVE